jgi:hypothetical protein
MRGSPTEGSLYIDIIEGNNEWRVRLGFIYEHSFDSAADAEQFARAVASRFAPAIIYWLNKEHASYRVQVVPR